MAAPRSPVLCKSHRRGTTTPFLVSLGLLGLALLAVVTPADVRFSDAAHLPDDRTISVGRWDVVAAEWDGTPVDQELLSRLQVVFRADGSWAVLLRRFLVAEGRSTNRQDVSPKTFEMETLGSERIKPSRYTGIYRLDGDTRVLCLVADGKPRPEEFSAPKHSDRMLVTLKRAKRPVGGR